MIIEVVGKEIEKIKGDFESYLNGLNMVGEISYSQYSELYDEGTKQIQRAYELGRAELEKENAELENKLNIANTNGENFIRQIADLAKENAELKLKLEALEGQTPWKDIKDKSEVIGQLTKAKEIIREYLKSTKSWNYDFADILKCNKKAEQFLNSEVEK